MALHLAALLALGALPFVLVVVHGLLVRLLRLGGIDLGPQPAAIVIVLLLNAAIVLLVVFARGVLGLGELAYVVLTANAMWFVYFQVFVNLSLTSLHARLLLAGLWHGAVEPRAMAQEYDSQAMLSARLARLLKLRQVALAGDILSLDVPYLMWLSFPLYWWRRLIGIRGEQLQLSGQPAASTPAAE